MALKLDSKGMATEMSVQKLFAEIHMKDNDLYNKFAALYEDVTGEECTLRMF